MLGFGFWTNVSAILDFHCILHKYNVYIRIYCIHTHCAESCIGHNLIFDFYLLAFHCILKVNSGDIRIGMYSSLEIAVRVSRTQHCLHC